jgi:putative flippase GtrA
VLRRSFAKWIVHEDSRLFARFVAVGVLNTLFGYTCFAVFVRIGLDESLALLGATVLGIAFNFKSTGALVFRSHDNRLILRFVLIYGVCYGVNLALLKLLKLTGWPAYVNGALSMPPVALLSFILMKRYVFPRQITTGTYVR